VRGWSGNPNKLFAQINKLRDEACDLEDFLRRNMRSIFFLNLPLLKEILINGTKRLSWAVVGAGIIVLIVVATHYLNTVEITLSVALGSAYISQALPLFKK
jgi:hypothetical protein